VTFTIKAQTVAFLNLNSQVAIAEGADWGLHGFAFSNDGSRLYVSFTNFDAKTIVAELRVSNGKVSPTSQRTLMEIANPDRVHNAGPLAIGADGYLYIPTGDGGGRGDPFANGQNPQTFLGKILRIDPEITAQNPYSVPPGNLFYDTTTDANGQDEIYLMGVRDPAAIWYDPLTRDGWILDHGEDGVQEINHIPWEGQPLRGGNLGLADHERGRGVQRRRPARPRHRAARPIRPGRRLRDRRRRRLPRHRDPQPRRCVRVR
jgi:hypothetical protein